jgi:hypothetical protein
MVKVLKRVKYCDVCDLFKKWLVENGHRFHRKYKIRNCDKGKSLRIYFDDVTPELRCYVSEGTIGISVHFKGECWDLLEEFDYFIRRGRNQKYYCTFCKEPKYYNTPQELLIDHSFENFLGWINDHFTQFHALELVKYSGSTCAFIIDTRESDRKDERNREAFRTLLKNLKRLGDDSPAPFHADKIKTTVIPVIKRKRESSIKVS